MATDIVMPQLGESITEGTIAKWLKNVGDKVQKDENILSISTDKVEAEIPSPVAGVLVECLAAENQTVAVGTVIARVGAENEVKTAKPAAQPATQAASQPKSEPITPAVDNPAPEPSAPAVPQKVYAQESSSSAPSSVGDVTANQFISPLVRRIAQEHRMNESDIFQIKGSGAEGRVTKKDLLAHIEQKKNQLAPSSTPAAPSAVPAQSNPQAQRVPQTSHLVQFPAGQNEQVVPMSNMRRVIMENMINSRRTSAHVTTFFEIDYTKIDQVRNANQAQFKEQEGVSLTYTTFLAAAVCQVLKRHPYINAQIRDGKIVFNKDVHLGIAVSISGNEPGLMVPVIKNCDQINLRGIALALHDLSSRTRTKKIKPDELTGGTFTITNPGNYGAVIGTPIINQPQAAILGVGRIAKQPAVINVDGCDLLGVRNMGMLALSFDHRLIDGATADMFMADFKQTLETWSTQP